MSPRKHSNRKRNLVQRRPTEVITGVGGAGVVYGLLTQAGLPVWLAVVIAVVAALVPGGISAITDALDG